MADSSEIADSDGTNSQPIVDGDSGPGQSNTNVRNVPSRDDTALLNETGPRSVAAVVGAYAVFVGLLTLAGYATDLRRLTDWNNDGISMFPNAAVCAAFAGAALLLLATAPDRNPRRIAVRLIASLVALLGGLTLLQHLAGVNLGIDTLLFERTWGQRAAAAPMRMGPPASTSNLIIGSALLLATYGAGARRLASALGIVVIAIASLSLVGYWFGADHLYDVTRATGIAFQTSSALAAIGIGLIASLPEHGLAAILRRDDSGGVIVRRMLLPIIALPLALGWLRVLGQQAGYFDTAFGTALLSLVLISMLVALLVWAAAGVSRHARRTRAAEEGVRLSEARLRQRASELEAIFNTSPIGLAIAEDPHGLHIRGNPANERLLGVPSGGELSLRGSPRADFRVLREGREVPVDALPMQRACRGEAIEGDLMDIERADGTVVTLYCCAAPLLDERGRPRGAVGAFLDVTPLQRAEAAVRESEQRLAGLINSAMDAVIAVDASQRVVLFNPAAERMFGCTAAEALGGSLDRFIPPRIREAHRGHIEQFGRTGATTRRMGALGALSGVRATGEEFPIEASISQIDLSGRKLFTVILRDITARRQAEAALQASERRLKAILEQFPAAVGVMDTNGAWTLTNSLMERYVPKAIPSTLPDRIHCWRAWDDQGNPFPPENWPGQRALRGEKVMPGMQMLFRTDEGEERWMRVSAAPLYDDHGAIISATCVVQDIDEIKRAQEALRDKSQELQAILDLAPVQIWFGDSACTRFTGNRRACEEHRLKPGSNASFGAPARELPENLRLEANGRLLSPEEMPMQIAARTGQPVEGFEHDVIHPDGARQTMIANVLPIKNADGSVRSIIGVYVDITERKQAEQERALLLESERAARAEAEQASRIKDEFLATLSHELRTPLNAILGWSRLIDMNPGDPKTVAEGVQVITRNAKMQADLIADLLDMSRIVSGKLRLEVEDVNLAEVITAAVDAVRHSAEAKQIRIEPVLSSVADTVRGDPGRLQQVVWNLLSNALKFTPKGGRIQVVLAKKDSHAEIVVSDTGMGINAEFLPHLFGRFRQADASAARQHGGLGLGLAIVKNLVELHGGTVRAESPGEGKGATFTVQLPLALTHAPSLNDRPPDTGREAGFTVGDVDLTGVTVLAIDDQADTRDLLSRVLGECHAEVILASSADGGLQALRDHRPHVVLCDIGMPGKDGYVFIREMHEQGHEIPTLAVTAFARPEDRLRAIRAGYQGHISKPLEPAELVATVAVFAKAQLTTMHHSEWQQQ